jgi:hypothetical protein
LRMRTRSRPVTSGTAIFPIQNQHQFYMMKNCMHFFSFLFFLLLFKHKKKGNQINILYEIKK